MRWSLMVLIFSLVLFGCNGDELKTDTNKYNSESIEVGVIKGEYLFNATAVKSAFVKFNLKKEAYFVSINIKPDGKLKKSREQSLKLICNELNIAVVALQGGGREVSRLLSVMGNSCLSVISLQIILNDDISSFNPDGLKGLSLRSFDLRKQSNELLPEHILTQLANSMSEMKLEHLNIESVNTAVNSDFIKSLSSSQDSLLSFYLQRFDDTDTTLDSLLDFSSLQEIQLTNNNNIEDKYIESIKIFNAEYNKRYNRKLIVMINGSDVM